MWKSLWVTLVTFSFLHSSILSSYCCDLSWSLDSDKMSKTEPSWSIVSKKTFWNDFYLLSETHQRSQVDRSLLKMRLHQWWCVALLNEAVVQCQPAEVAIHLQRHRVPVSIIDTMTREAQNVRTGTASPKTTGQLEPQLPIHQLQQHKCTEFHFGRTGRPLHHWKDFFLQNFPVYESCLDFCLGYFPPCTWIVVNNITKTF